MRHLMGRLFLVVVLSGIAVTPVMLQAIPCTCDFMEECTGDANAADRMGSLSAVVWGLTAGGLRV